MDLSSIRAAALCAALVCGLAGCQSEDEACPRITGVFEAQYAQINGNCPAAFDPLPVDFSSGRGGVTAKTQYRVNDKIETEIVLKGCTVRMSQVLIDAEETRRALVEGDAIVIESDNELSGMVYRQEYNDQGQTVCQGQYDALYTKNTVTIAAAAQD